MSDAALPVHTIAQPIPVQILSILAYAGFAISVSIVAMAMFGVLGLGLAFFMAYQWTNIPALSGSLPGPSALAAVKPALPVKTSGNASFDRYRTDMLARLEEEGAAFGDFVQKLRAARDRDEFERFMNDRRDAQPVA